VSVDLFDGAAEAGISEREVIDVGVRPVLRGSVVHDFLESRIDDINLRGTTELSHVRGVNRDNVTHHVEESLVLLLLILLGHASRGNVLKVLQPFKVGAGYTSTVSKHVRNNNNSFSVKHLFSHEGSRAVSTFEDDLTVKEVGVVLVDSLLLGGRDEDITFLLHERSGIDCLNFVGVTIVSECSLREHLGSNIIDIKTLGVPNSRVVLNDSNDDTSILLDELSGPVADSTESLDDESFVSDSLLSKLSSFDERVSAQELLDAIVDSETGTLSTS